MDQMAYFMKIYGTLPRAGPGDNRSTRRAFELCTGLPDAPRILDIGCGPGVQTLELARLSAGPIVALDLMPEMISKLESSIADQGLEERIELVQMDMAEIDSRFPAGSFDLVWSEGAIYFLGFEGGLEKVRPLLRPGGYLAVSEAVWLKPDPPEPVLRFWREYPGIATIDEKLRVVESAGYHLLGHFVLPASSWTEDYYDPLEARADELESKWADQPTGLDVIAEARLEAQTFREYHEYFSYAFFVMEKGAGN